MGATVTSINGITWEGRLGPADRKLIERARAAAAVKTAEGAVAFLAVYRHGIGYGPDTDLGTLYAAVLGGAQVLLDELADIAERELKSNRVAELEAELTAMRRDRDEYARRAEEGEDA